MYPIRSSETRHFTIIIKALGGKSFQLDVASNDTILVVKGLIKDSMGIPLDQQCLFLAGERLNDHRTVRNYSIHTGSTLHLALCLR